MFDDRRIRAHGQVYRAGRPDMEDPKEHNPSSGRKPNGNSIKPARIQIRAGLPEGDLSE
jgi:hypothetical protein